MLRLKYLTNKFQKRLIRPWYAQTQATPYAATLDPTIGSGSSFTAPGGAFLYKNGLVPGSVMVKSAVSDQVLVATGGTAGSLQAQAFGLLANFVGGDLDELGDENEVGVWRGPDAVFELLAPAWDDTNLAANYAAATAGNPVALFTGTDGRLTSAGGASGAQSSRQTVAYLIDRPTASRIVITLAI